MLNYWNLKNQKLIKRNRKIKNHSKPPKPVRQSLFKQYQQKSNIVLVVHWKCNPFASWKSLYESKYQSAFEQQYLENGESKHFLHINKYLISFLMICRLIDFAFLNIYNPGHNILAFFNNLAQVRIATSKTILDI